MDTEQTTQHNQNDDDHVRPMSDQEARDYHGITVNENGEKEKQEYVHEVHYEAHSWWSLLWQYFKHLPLTRKLVILAGAAVFIALCVVTAWFMLLAGGFIAAAAILIYIIHKLIS
jgi:hypothetical protein